MRFCIVSTQKNWGGGEVLVASLADRLLSSGHAVGWIARDNSEVLSRLEDDDASILHRTRKRGQNLRDWFAIREVIQNWAPDVLIMNDTHAVPLAGSAAWFSRGVKPLRLAYKHTVFPLRSRLKYQLLSDRVICVSQAVRDTMIRGGMHEDSAVVIYGGAEKPTRVENAKSEVRQELGVPDDGALLLAVGNLLDCKGHLDLVSAMHQLERSGSNARLVIAGEGQERAAIESRIAELSLQSRVKLLGYRSDVNRIMEAADLVVHPSHAEGLSLVLIQAQMLGKPIVATAVGGAKEVLAANSSDCTSWIAQPSAPEDLAAKIGAALAMLQDADRTREISHRLAANAVRAEELFSVDQSCRHLVDLSASLLRHSVPVAASPAKAAYQRV